MKRWLSLIAILFLLSRGTLSAHDNFFHQLFSQYPELFDTVLQQKKEYRLQIIYTEINRNKDGRPTFTTHTFDADSYYYYTASMVKLPASILSLEKIHQLKPYGVSMHHRMVLDTLLCDGLNRDNTMQSAPVTSIAQYIKEMLLVSNNFAFNPLYDFLGQDYFNKRLHELGYTNAIIANRFSSCDSIDNRIGNPVSILDSNCKVLYSQPATYNNYSPAYRGKLNPLVGNAYLGDGMLRKQPKNFTYANYIPLTELHRLLIHLMFPEEQHPGFNLADKDYAYFKHCMGLLPRESAYPIYNPNDYPDNLMKFFMGFTDDNQMPSNIRIFNKVGQAYGFTTDCSYIIDTLNDVDFFLSCSMYTNKDGILNDGVYEYDQVALPFFHHLFDAVYEYELLRKRKAPVNLTLPDFKDISPIDSSKLYQPETTIQIEQHLAALADSMWNNRKIWIAYDSILPEKLFHDSLQRGLQQIAFANYPFKLLQQHQIHIHYSPDSTFRIFSWVPHPKINNNHLVQFHVADTTYAFNLKELSATRLGWPQMQMQQIISPKTQTYILVFLTADSNQFIKCLKRTANHLESANIISINKTTSSELLVESSSSKVTFDETKHQLRIPFHVGRKEKIKLVKLLDSADGGPQTTTRPHSPKH